MTTDFQTAEQLFTIPAANLACFEEAMKKLTRRAKKLSVGDKLGHEVVRTFIEVRKRVDWTGVVRKTTEVLHEVCVWGPVVKFDGWVFIGRLDFKAVPGATLRMMVPGETCPDGFGDAPATRCDHCGHRRRRNDSFIVRHDDGRLMVVGRTCLGDFLGQGSPETLAKIATLIMQVCVAGEESESWGGLGGSKQDVWGPTAVLALAFYAMRKWGWAPSRSAGSTRDAVLDLLEPSMDREVEAARKEALAEVSDRDWERASEAIEWVSGLDTSNSDYLHNLKAILTAGVVWKTLGIAVSGAMAHDRHLGREVERKAHAKVAAKSGHVGTVGDRLDFDAETIFVEYINGNWGTTTVIKFRDDDGNVYTWFASGGKDVEQGQRLSVRGTIKKHDEYRGEKQTVLTRCKLTKAA